MFPKVSFLLLSCLMICEINPNPGRIKIYTSGCPKNQNKCWYRIGSPPPEGSKKAVFKFRSVKSIVIAPAKTGKDKINRIAVIKIDHGNNIIWFSFMLLGIMFIIVQIKLIAPKIEEIPAKWSEKIVKSTEMLLWAILLDNGG